MTEEEIRQKAEDYADRLCKRWCEKEWERLVDTYIAGAKARDEEIAELKDDIFSFRGHYDSLFEGFCLRGKKLGELMKENVLLNENNKLLKEKYEGKSHVE
jgi:hypothetical protein